MKGRSMNILKPIIICLVLVALEPITLYAQENIAKGQAGYLSIHDKTKGLKLGGARHKYDLYRRRWYTVPIRMPAPAGRPLRPMRR